MIDPAKLPPHLPPEVAAIFCPPAPEGIRIVRVNGTPEETAAIDAFITEAFQTAEHSDGTEAALTRHLRTASHRKLFGMGFAAVDVTKPSDAPFESELVGHVLVSKTYVRLRDDPASEGGIEAALLAPLSVKASHRRRGIDEALCPHALRMAGRRQCGAVMVLGDPKYYGRFGFAPFEELGLTVDGDPKRELRRFCGVCFVDTSEDLRETFRDTIRGGEVDMLMREKFPH